MFYVSLPGAPSEIPKGLEGLHHLALLKTTTAVQLQALAQAVSSVTAVLAGKNTASDLQATAAGCWPQASVYRYLGDRQWQTVAAVSVNTPTIDKPAAVPVDRVGRQDSVMAAGPEEASVVVDPEYSRSLAAARKQAKDHIDQCFRLHSWGKDKQRVEIARLEGAFGVLLQQHPELQSLEEDLRKAASQGDEACRLIETLKQKLATEGKESARAWLDKVKSNTSARIGKSLDIELKKTLEYRSGNYQKHKANKGFVPSMPPLLLVNGQHPKAVQNLSPSPQWTVLIDESGTHFGAEVDQLGDADKDIGRMVALLLPQSCQLPPLKPGFHAVKEATDVIERVLADLMKAPVGILGFTSKDSLTGRYSWFEKVEQLVRWVLLLLPIDSQQPLKVRVMIENRSDYTSDINLGPMAESITADLMRLNAGRYQSMQLSMAIMGKEGHAANGYVDTLANCWGSNMADKRKLLNLCKLPGYCLIRPSDDAVYERLLFALESHARLRPSDWYQLQQEGGDYLESANSLVSGCMEQLGQGVQADQNLWQMYLTEVQQRLRNKDFRLAGLGRALDWLDRFKPASASLPGNLQLRLLAARLAYDNHQGHCNLGKVAEAMQLARELRDEMAPEACEMILRIAVAATNAFDFRCCEPVIDEWLGLPVATVGLLNHAKLHSTQGQLLAFQGRYIEAEACFLTARLQFSKLSDVTLVARDIDQSCVYQLSTRIRNPAVGANQYRDGLLAHLEKQIKTGKTPLLGRLAASGQTLRFSHQLTVRSLLEKPEVFAEERQQYLAAIPQWQTGDDHPWPLIQAYRGWLLLEEGRSDKALALLQNAVDQCQQSGGATLHWMAVVLQALAIALGLNMATPTAQTLQDLQQRLPLANHTALQTLLSGRDQTQGQLLELLEQCLPFNFH